MHWSTRVDGYFDAPEVVGFLRCVLGSLPGKVIVVWDGSNHKGPLIRAFVKRNKRLWLERLPPYAPELNPVEVVWSWLKYSQLANFVPDDLAELDRAITNRLRPLRRNHRVLSSLWNGSELPGPDDLNS